MWWWGTQTKRNNQEILDRLARIESKQDSMIVSSRKLHDKINVIYYRERQMATKLDELTTQVGSTIESERQAVNKVTELKKQISDLQTQIANSNNDPQLESLRQQLADSEAALKAITGN